MKVTKLLSTALATGALILGATSPIHAATLYDHVNFERNLGTWNRGTTYVGDNANDRASSITVNGRNTRIYADLNHKGPSYLLQADHNDLNSLSEGLAWWQNWSDRISSLSKE